MMSCRTACSCSLQVHSQQQAHRSSSSSSSSSSARARQKKKLPAAASPSADSALLALLRAHDTDAAFGLFSGNPEVLPCSPATASRLLAQLSFNSDKSSSFSRAALLLQRLRARNALSLLDANALSLAAAAAARSGNATLARSLILHMLRQGLFPDRRRLGIHPEKGGPALRRRAPPPPARASGRGPFVVAAGHGGVQRRAQRLRGRRGLREVPAAVVRRNGP